MYYRVEIEHIEFELEFEQYRQCMVVITKACFTRVCTGLFRREATPILSKKALVKLYLKSVRHRMQVAIYAALQNCYNQNFFLVQNQIKIFY